MSDNNRSPGVRFLSITVLLTVTDQGHLLYAPASTVVFWTPSRKPSIHNIQEDNNSLWQFGHKLLCRLDHPDHPRLHFTIVTRSTNCHSWFWVAVKSWYPQNTHPRWTDTRKTKTSTEQVLNYPELVRKTKITQNKSTSVRLMSLIHLMSVFQNITLTDTLCQCLALTE